MSLRGGDLWVPIALQYSLSPSSTPSLRGADLAVSASLLFCALLSALHLLWAYFQRVADGQIRLPEHSEPTDAFDVVKPEDIVEGNPVDADRAWSKIRTQRIFIVGLCASTLVLDAVAFAITPQTTDILDLISNALRVTFELYITALASRLLKEGSGPLTSSLTFHLTGLLSTAAVALIILRVVPSEGEQAYSNVSTLEHLRLASFIIYILATAAALTLPRGPPLHLPPEQFFDNKTVHSATNKDPVNVAGVKWGSVLDLSLFSFAGKVVTLASSAKSVEIGDLPIIPGSVRSPVNFDLLTNVIRRRGYTATFTKKGSGWNILRVLISANKWWLFVDVLMAAVSAIANYLPPIAIQRVIKFIEEDPNRDNIQWGWVAVLAVCFGALSLALSNGQVWAIVLVYFNSRLKNQVNLLLYKKTLTRKHVAAVSTEEKAPEGQADGAKDKKKDKKDDDDSGSASKGQIFNLFTTDTDRVSQLPIQLFLFVCLPVELVFGGWFLVKLMGVSAVVGFVVMMIFMPINRKAGKLGLETQKHLMKARDTRVSLMNEVLGSIRMLKFMAWERTFEDKVLDVRKTELKYQFRTFLIKTSFKFIWEVSPVLVAVSCFAHFTLVRGQPLTPSVAFTAILVFAEMKVAINALPDVLVKVLECTVSLKRLDRYLGSEDVTFPTTSSAKTISLQSCSITWARSDDRDPSQTPRSIFTLRDLNFSFPASGLSLICGRLGSGKTLLLQALLGEADVLSGQLICPRSTPDALAALSATLGEGEGWVKEGLCAYVPQVSFFDCISISIVHSPSIRLLGFEMLLSETISYSTFLWMTLRYQQTLEACALLPDLAILEDGDMAEIGERGINLSGGQKARKLCIRVPQYVLLDDVLSAVDAHTADHLFKKCLKGELMSGRTVILVSHHVQLCAPGAAFVVALDNGGANFIGDSAAFLSSPVMKSLVKAHDEQVGEQEQEATEQEEAVATTGEIEKLADPAGKDEEKEKEKKAPRKFGSEEERAVGRIARAVYKLYLTSLGGVFYWVLFTLVYGLAALGPVAVNGWLRYWSDRSLRGEQLHSTSFYIGIYAAISIGAVTFEFTGSIHASKTLYKKLLEAILFAQVRFHDTTSRGRILNRFGKDFEGIDDALANTMSQTLITGLQLSVAMITVSVVGGPVFLIPIVILGCIYFFVGKAYATAARDLRRLDSVSRSPLYSMYSETIAGVSVIRAFGASTKFMKDMMSQINTNMSPQYWISTLNLWLMMRYFLLSTSVLTLASALCVSRKSIDAGFAGFILTFASTLIHASSGLVRVFVQMEQSCARTCEGVFRVALRKAQSISNLVLNQPGRNKGALNVKMCQFDMQPDLPNVLHNLSFEVVPGEKVGILGRTGSGKSTLALSLLRFVDPTEGKITVDDLDITQIGLTDLRSRLTIIPQDPHILSGSLRSTLDVFGEYDDALLFESLRRVQLIPSSSTPEDEANVNVFRNLDSSVSEGGENFSTGEKQLICMARAVLRRSKILIMDEATASVDYATDELISQTIRQEFKNSTILTIAHRLRTIIDYDRVMLLDQGRIVEFDKPAVLLQNQSSQFYALCRATGQKEFSSLKKMAGV
ncbi:multidrug resistance-associated ABC transporter [Flagelloscypha sp. PMI_526]|nr:multidrug resistance-associated ABC transporter [Flagelloscypha sp. PMI_526]